MGASSAKASGDAQDSENLPSEGAQDDDKQPIIEKDDSRRRSSTRPHSTAESVHCPTCQGTGRIPRGQANKLLAVIPCNDQRLKPRHTKLYVTISVAVCAVISTLVLFFLFPRSVLLSPTTVKSSFVFLNKDDVQIHITNVLNITNQNFGVVQAENLTVQALNDDTVVGTVFIRNVTTVRPLSTAVYSFMIPIKLTDMGLIDYCKNSIIPVHIVYLHLQISMKVFYLTHYEQLSLETYEYIDCGANTTTPHSVLPPSSV